MILIRSLIFSLHSIPSDCTFMDEQLLGTAAKDELEGDEDVNTDDDKFITSRASDGTALPFGWKEVFDSTSGNNYYFNEVTGQSQWLNPTQTPFSQGGTGSTTPVRTYELIQPYHHHLHRHRQSFICISSPGILHHHDMYLSSKRNERNYDLIMT